MRIRDSTIYFTMKSLICKQISVNFFGIFKRFQKKHIPHTRYGMIFGLLTLCQTETDAGLDDFLGFFQSAYTAEIGIEFF